MIFKKWQRHSLSNLTSAIYFLTAKMHSYTMNGSHSVRWKEMVGSQLTYKMIIILEATGEKKKKSSYLEVL